MTDKITIVHLLKNEKNRLTNEFGVRQIGLFGSYSRNEANGNSDIDLLVDMAPDFSKLTLLQINLEQLLHAHVQLTRVGPHLSETFLKRIAQDIIYV